VAHAPSWTPLVGLAPRPLPQRLLDAGFRVIRYDRIGYGHSDRRSRGAAHTLDANAGELVDLLTAMSAESPILVGWSYGDIRAADPHAQQAVGQ